MSAHLSECGTALAHAAERLVGTPFRLHGRDPERGLDCVGLVLAALAAVGRRVRVPPYRLRMREIGGLVTAASEAGLVEGSGPVRPGDVLLVWPGPAQHHLAVAASGGGFVHAHAGLGRVVLTPAPLPWAEERRWRLGSRLAGPCAGAPRGGCLVQNGTLVKI